MTSTDRIKIEKSLKFFDLYDNNNLTKDDIKKAYYKVSKKFHPDTASNEYKDGKMFLKTKIAYEFLMKNYKYVILYLNERNNCNFEEIDQELLKRANLENEIKTQNDIKRREMIKKRQFEEKEEYLKMISKLSSNYHMIRFPQKINYLLNEIKRHYYDDYNESRKKLVKLYDNYNPIIRLYDYTIIMELSLLFFYIVFILIQNTLAYLLIHIFLLIISSLVFMYLIYRSKNNLIFYTNLTDKEFKGNDYKVYLLKTFIKIMGISVFATGIISLVFGIVSAFKNDIFIQMISGILFIIYGILIFISSNIKIKAI